MDDDKLVSIREKTDSYGSVEKMKVVFAKGKGKGRTMNVNVCEYQYGSVSDEPVAELEFKRSPRKKKTSSAGTR